MAEFRPFEMEGMPIEEQFMDWDEMIKAPYDKNKADAYTKARIILMNGIENNAVLTLHAMHRMIDDPEIQRQLAILRRVESQQQQTINWLNPADQTVVETTIGYEQVAVDLTANLAKNEPDPYVKQTLDFALLEDFDHLFRFGCLMEILEDQDPNTLTQGKTEIKPGRPTIIEHRHPNDSMRKHFDKDTASTKTKLNYYTIVSGEQQTELYYKSHGFMYGDDLARKLYSEIAEIEEQHVTQYGMLGDPRETMLEKEAMMQLNEAYNYFSFAQTESDSRIKQIWKQFMMMEITHLNMVNELMNRYEKRDIRDVVKEDAIGPLIVFEPNKDYVNRILETQIDLQPNNMEYVRIRDLPDDWSSFVYQAQVNQDIVPSEDVVSRLGRDLAQKADAAIYRRVNREMADRVEKRLRSGAAATATASR
jgi:rubrerythrin